MRTDFTDQAKWQQVQDAAVSTHSDGFRAHVLPVSDPRLEGADWTVIRQEVRSLGECAEVAFVADGRAMEGDFPILVIDLGSEEHRPFRCAARQLWVVDNNLNLANMGFEEFVIGADADGVFRGC